MNKLKLEYEMKMKGITMAEMCNMLQISRSAFIASATGKRSLPEGRLRESLKSLGLTRLKRWKKFF